MAQTNGAAHTADNSVTYLSKAHKEDEPAW
jgi:hypothetical protein